MRVVENAGITTPGTPPLYLLSAVAQLFSDASETRRQPRISVLLASPAPTEKNSNLFAFLQNRFPKGGYTLSRNTFMRTSAKLK
jgi:hypothetical protein